MERRLLLLVIVASDLRLRTIKFCRLRRNVEPCHKHFVDRLTWTTNEPLTSDECHQRYSTVVCITLGGWTVQNTRWSQILAENPIFCLPHLHWTSSWGWPRLNFSKMFDTHITDWATVWWRNYDNILSRFGRILERDGRTDGRTDGQNCYINIAR